MLRELFKGVSLCFLLVGASGGCVPPDLGDVPFRCNNGIPECPDGYRCVRHIGQGHGVCLREGAQLPQAYAGTTEEDAAAANPPPTKPDSGFVPRPLPDTDAGKPDLAGPNDLAPPQQPDLAAPPKDSAPPLKKDSGPTHLGCQSNAECTDPSSPCCCPFLVQEFWTCMPLCLDPICF